MNSVSNSIVDTGIQPTGVYLNDIALTPDAKYLLVSSYAWATGDGDIFDGHSYQKLASVQFGDFAGQVAVSADGAKAIFGSAGNPQFQGGGLTVVDIASGAITATVTIDLADHLVVSDHNEIFASSGDAPGIDMFVLQTDGTLVTSKQFVLGINQFMLTCCYGAPQNDDIEKLVFKP
jgi:DNA-binding beta-propeller fold protein YncE